MNEKGALKTYTCDKNPTLAIIVRFFKDDYNLNMKAPIRVCLGGTILLNKLYFHKDKSPLRVQKKI